MLTMKDCIVALLSALSTLAYADEPPNIDELKASFEATAQELISQRDAGLNRAAILAGELAAERLKSKARGGSGVPPTRAPVRPPAQPLNEGQ